MDGIGSGDVVCLGLYRIDDLCDDESYNVIWVVCLTGHIFRVAVVRKTFT